jgi:hypothetical protein
MLAVAIAPHGLMAVPQDEATLSQALHTVGLLRPHGLVGYWWQHTRLCPIFRHNSRVCNFVSHEAQKIEPLTEMDDLGLLRRER